MSRDYSSRRNNPPAKNGKRKPAKRPTPAAQPVRKKASAASKRSGAPGCVWLLCGLFIGVAVAAGFYIFGRGTPAGIRQDISVNMPNGAPRSHGLSAPAHHASQADAGKAAPQEKPRFSFYKMLPNYKVEIPDNDNAPQGSAYAGEHPIHDTEPSDSTPPPTGPSSSLPSTTAPTAAAVAVPAPSSSGYVIQAGAFSTARDAQRRQAQLALLGITSQVVDIQTSAGHTVYRVQSNTIGSGAQVQEYVRRMKKNSIEALVRQAP